MLGEEHVVHSGWSVELKERMGRDKTRAGGRRQEPDQEESPEPWLKACSRKCLKFHWQSLLEAMQVSNLCENPSPGS